MGECIHGLTEGTCAICKHGPRRPPRREPVATFTARYDGQCPECDLPIHAGIDVVHKMSDDSYIHKDCN